MGKFAASLLFSLLVILSSFLFASVNSSSSAFAVTICPDDPSPGGEPNPQPCKYACYTDKLTDNYVTDADGKAPIEIPITKDDLAHDQPFTVDVSENYVVDFSKLQGIFGAANSDFGEGGFQDDSHRQEDISGLNSQDFNKFHGPGQKIAAKTLIDDLRVKYVKYIWLNSHLPEASHEYTDFNNEGDPVTIYQMITDLGFPNPPEPPPPGADEAAIKAWQDTWGKYWEKIPTTYSEFYRGYLVFRYAMSEKKFLAIETAGDCPDDTGRTPIEFIMPEFQRTTSIFDQLNKIIVPCAAQSFRHGEGPNPDDPDNCFRQYLAANSTQNKNASVLGKFIKACKDIINGASKTLIKQLRNAGQVSFKILNPVKIALAASPTPALTPTPAPCFVPLKSGKEGTAPFCALPEFSEYTMNGVPQRIPNLGPNDHCLDKPTTNKLDNDGNPRVVCVFNISFSKTFIASSNIPQEIGKRADTDFDNCVDHDGDGDLRCTVKLRIWPVYHIPFLSEIWNNTLYSNEDERGVGSPQLTGRPGVYSNFIPKAISEILFDSPNEQALRLLRECLPNYDQGDYGTIDPAGCQRLIDFLNASGQIGCVLGTLGVPEPYKELEKCITNILSRNLPGQVASDVQGTSTSNVLAANSGSDAKQRFIGATDCAKVFTRDISLKPRALQKEQGIEEQKCNLQARALPEGPPGQLGPAPPNVPPNNNTCPGTHDYVLNNPLGNFGDPECNFSITDLTEYLEQIDPTNVADWLTIILDESGNNPNSWLTGDPSALYHSPDPAGAWGLFQMGRGKNGQYDHGDVVWQLQVYNAVSYNNYLISIGIPFCYWEAAMNHGIAQGC